MMQEYYILVVNHDSLIPKPMGLGMRSHFLPSKKWYNYLLFHMILVSKATKKLPLWFTCTVIYETKLYYPGFRAKLNAMHDQLMDHISQDEKRLTPPIAQDTACH